MSARVAIVTQAVGDSFLSYWKQHCEWNWRKYAQRHGYDLHVLTEPIDPSPRGAARSSSWQKCLLLSQPFLQRYQQLILLDADVVINFHTAPPIAESVPEERVGGVISGAYLHDDLKVVFLERVRKKKYPFRPDLSDWDTDQRRFYEEFGLSGGLCEVVQGGVLVASPLHHRGLFEKVYYRKYPRQDRNYEQVPLSHEILQSGMFCRLNSRFNTVFFERMVVHYPYLLNKQLSGYEMLARIAVFVEWSNSFFLHFAYERDFARFLPPEEKAGS
ncbi:MAG: hypothetical protein HY735_27140 [Verrucomicrobia bacterium]|nr:hypothetical protein [Verrucomicrobiota bacterium]